MDNFTQFVLVIATCKPEGLQILGTSFMVSNDGICVTAWHAVSSYQNNLVLLAPKINSLNEYQDTIDTSCNIVPLTIINFDPTKDLVLLKVQQGFQFHFDLPSLGSLDNVNVGDDVIVLGYPHCVDNRQVLTYQKTVVGAKVLLAPQSIKNRYAILNIQSRPGQSGSIILNSSLEKIVGLLIGTYAPDIGVSIRGINPAELNQTTHIISAEYIRELLDV